MFNEISILTFTAASLGFIHTILGPDHYIPFIVMAKARDWSIKKTTLVTTACGVGHVLGSIIIGFIGIGFGIAIDKLEVIESVRGEIAGWLLIGFGLVYMIWGLRQAYKKNPHTHIHLHSNGTMHTHEHIHHMEHAHPHNVEKKSLTPWILFTIFVLGPCEVLIPILMYPAATRNTYALVLATSVFGVITIITMLTIVLTSVYGIKLLLFKKLENYMHIIAGALILLCGMAIKLLGF